MSRLRTLSTRNLVVLVVAVVAVAAGGTAIAVAAGGTGPAPAPQPLDTAIHDALAAPAPDGVTARVKFTNNLLPSGGLLGGAGSALVSGASGRLWLTNDGRGRVELQSDAGDVQIVWSTTTGAVSVYDASSNTVYRGTLPQSRHDAATHEVPSLAEIDRFLAEVGAHWALSDPQPTDVAGQPAYNVSITPKSDAGLLGSLELAWDAVHGAPLRVAVYARSTASPVLAFDVTDISYGTVPSSDVDVAPPSDAKVVDLGSATGSSSGGTDTPPVTGLDAVTAKVDFPVLAPDSLAGRPRRDVRLVGGDTVLVRYGDGLGLIALAERGADGSGGGTWGRLGSLPTVSLDGVPAHELATPLGTVLAWRSGGTSVVLAGSVTAAAAESAARAVG